MRRALRGIVTGGRTETFGVKNPAKKLAGCAVYKRSGIVVRQGKPIAIGV